MHDRDFVQSEVMEGSADMRDREDVDPRESFPMHFADDTDGGDYWSPFFLPRVPWGHAPFGGGRGRGFGRRGRGMMMMNTDPRGSMFFPRPIFHPGRPFPVFGDRGRGGCRGRGMGRGRGGCGRGGWRAYNDAMVERFEHCRLSEDPTSDSDADGTSGGSGESDTGETVEVEAHHQNVTDHQDDGVSSHQAAAASNPNEPAADGDREIPANRHRVHCRFHHRRHGRGHCMEHHGPPTESLHHPYFRMPPVWQPLSDCDQQGHCKKCFKKAMKRSFKVHKKAWKRCTKKDKAGIWKSDGECVHSDDAEAGGDGEEIMTSPYSWGYFPHPWGYFPPHFLHREFRRHAGKHSHGGKGKRCRHGCCQQGKATEKQQQTTGDEQCDVIDDDAMPMDDGDHHTAAEPKSSANTTENAASGTSGKK